MNGDNFGLSTVSHRDNYRELHFLRDGAPPHFAFLNRFFPPEVTFLLATHTYACFFMVLAFARPPLWSSGQSFCIQIQRSRVRFPALPDFLSGSGSGTGSTQPREVN